MVFIFGVWMTMAYAIARWGCIFVEVCVVCAISPGWFPLLSLHEPPRGNMLCKSPAMIWQIVRPAINNKHPQQTCINASKQKVRKANPPSILSHQSTFGKFMQLFYQALGIGSPAAEWARIDGRMLLELRLAQQGTCPSQSIWRQVAKGGGQGWH